MDHSINFYLKVQTLFLALVLYYCKIIEKILLYINKNGNTIC